MATATRNQDETEPFSEEQILTILEQADGGLPLPELIRQHRTSEGAFYRWKSKSGGLELSEARREVVTSVCEPYAVSRQRACGLIQLSRSRDDSQAQPRDDEPLRQAHLRAKAVQPPQLRLSALGITGGGVNRRWLSNILTNADPSTV